MQEIATNSLNVKMASANFHISSHILYYYAYNCSNTTSLKKYVHKGYLLLTFLSNHSTYLNIYIIHDLISGWVELSSIESSRLNSKVRQLQIWSWLTRPYETNMDYYLIGKYRSVSELQIWSLRVELTSLDLIRLRKKIWCFHRWEKKKILIKGTY